MKVLVFGYGSMGRRHATTAHVLGHHVGVFDPAMHPLQFPTDIMSVVTERFERSKIDIGQAEELQQRASGFVNERAAWNWTPDAVVIATPAATHVKIIKRAGEFTNHLFVEKPLALSIEDFEHNALRFSCASLQVGCNWRFHPLVCELKQRMKQTEHAVPLEAVFWVMSTARRDHPERQYEDALLECGAHEIDLALYLLGPATVTYAAREQTAWRVDLIHENGCVTKIAMDDSAQHPTRGLRIAWQSWYGGYTVPYDDPRSEEATDISYARELQYFLELAAGNEPPDYDGAVPATLADGLAVLKICDAARAAVEQPLIS